MKLRNLVIVVCILLSSCKSKESNFEFHKTKRSSGRVKEIGMLLDNKKEGLWVYFRDLGVLGSEIYYHNNLKEGPSITYGIDGEITSIENYHNGKLNGYTELKNSGQLIYKGYYKNGELDGNWEYYHDGKLERKVTFKDGKTISLKKFMDLPSPPDLKFDN